MLRQFTFNTMVGLNRILTGTSTAKLSKSICSCIIKKANNLQRPTDDIYQNIDFLRNGLCTDIRRFNHVTPNENLLSESSGKTETSLNNQNHKSDISLKSMEESDTLNREARNESATLNDDIISLKEENLELFQELSQGNSLIYDELRSLQMKIDIAASQFGVVVNMNKIKWMELYKSSHQKQKSFIANLIKIAIKDHKVALQKEEARARRLQMQAEYDSEDDDDGLSYRLFKNSLFLRFRAKALKKLLYTRAFSAMMYSPEILIDCSYQDYMTDFEIKYLAKQLAETIGVNFRSQSPFSLVFCNFDENDLLGRSMSKYHRLFYHKCLPITVCKESYLDLFPRDRLVYLTSHCKTELQGWDPEKRYIIGAFLDKTNPKPISLAKAKEDKIEMARFPLEKYLNWGTGRKTLTINQVLKVMLNLKNYDNDWTKAFEVIPSRLLANCSSGNMSHRGRGRKGNVFNTVESIFNH